MKRILVIRFGSLGDVILASPAVLNLKISYPQAELTVLTKERFAPVVRLMDGVDHVATLPENTGIAGLTKLLLELDEYAYDAVVDLHGNPRSWLARKLIAASYKAVYPKRRLDRRRIVRGRQMPTGGDWPHTIELYNTAVREVGARVMAQRPLLTPPGLQAGGDELERLFAGHDRVVAIAPGAAHSNKQWPVERFAETAKRLNNDCGYGLVWAVTGKDAGRVSFAGQVAPGGVVELVDLPIPELADVLARCRATVANDSGIAHLSSAVGTPVVALFGPTHPALGFAPAGLLDRIVEVEEYCRPCSLHGAKPCFREERFCFTRISPEDVEIALNDVPSLQGTPAPALFVDRDGTLVEEKHFLGDPNGIEFIEGSIEALRDARKRGFRIVIVSNQSGIARGILDIPTVERVNARLLELLSAEGVTVDALYYCPHHPRGKVGEFSYACDCRKPAPGMAEQAARRLKLDLRRSWVVGDKMDDVNLGRVVGARSILVRTGYGEKHEPTVASMRLRGRTAVANNLREAVDLILASGDSA